MGSGNLQWIKIAPGKARLEGGAGKKWGWTAEKAEQAEWLQQRMLRLGIGRAGSPSGSTARQESLEVRG